MTRIGHPRDEWVDVTAIGDPVPRRLLAVDGYEVEIAEAKERTAMTAREFQNRLRLALTYQEGNLAYLREKYAIGFITYEELCEGLDSVLAGGPVNVPKAKPPVSSDSGSPSEPSAILSVRPSG